MGNYKQGNRSGGRGFDRGRDRRDSSDRTQMHHAVCSDCGRDCEVPFRPSGDKPVFCSDCFGAKENSGGGRNERRSSNRNARDKQMFSAVCDKCHKDCEVPFRPTGDKPIYCSDCFGKTERRGGDRKPVARDQHQKQFEMLNNKLDSVLELLSKKTVTKKKVEKKKPVVKKVEKIVKKVNDVKKKVSPKKTVKKVTAKKKIV